MYFRKLDNDDQTRKWLRNRAYDIFHKNRYKRVMKDVLKFTVELQFGDTFTFSSIEAVMAHVKVLLDDACLTIDEVAIQGVINVKTAARCKDRMCRAILRAGEAKGLIKKPDDPFIPAYKALNYDMPVCYKTREPRPWQLPGWKSPWMLLKEYNKWKETRKATADAA